MYNSPGSQQVADNLSHPFSNEPLEETDIRGGEGVNEALHDAGHSAPSPSALGMEAEGWVALAMLILLGVLLWRGVPKLIGGMLDNRIAAIRAQLDEAKRLRTEAEALKAEYHARAQTALGEAEAIRDGARREADAIVAQAHTDSAALIARRAAMAEAKIAAAERAAVADVQQAAVSTATAAAGRLIADRAGEDADRVLVDRAISGLARRG